VFFVFFAFFVVFVLNWLLRRRGIAYLIETASMGLDRCWFLAGSALGLGGLRRAAHPTARSAWGVDCFASLAMTVLAKRRRSDGVCWRSHSMTIGITP
jgi:hypothetical protein